MTVNVNGGSTASQKALLIIERFYTEEGEDVLADVPFVKRDSLLKDKDGEVIFEMKGIEAPESWSQLAVDVVANKYFRKAGVPLSDGTTGPETSIKQPVLRMAKCWRKWGEEYGYFASEEAAQTFEDECVFLLINQFLAPNSPQWFNTGLNSEYGITGPAQGHHYVDPKTKQLTKSVDSYTHPQPHACLPYGSRVNTTEGLIPIGDVVLGINNGKSYVTFDKEGKQTPVEAGICNGKRNLIRLELKDGSFLRLTPDHIVPVMRDGQLVEVQAIDIVVGEDSIVLTRELLLSLSKTLSEIPFELTEDLAWLSGVMIGNGYSGRAPSATSNTWELKVNTKSEVNRIEDILIRYAVPYSVTDKSWGYIVRGYGDAGKNFWSHLDLWDKTHAKVVPQWVFRSSSSYVGALLNGLFGTDGNVTPESNERVSVRLSNTSYQVISSAQVLLRSMGIFSSVSPANSVTTDGYTRKDCWHVSISDTKSIDLFKSLVGVTHGEKLKALTISREFNPDIDYRKSCVLVVDRIKAGRELVYDIQTKSSTFWVEGLLVHNCFIQKVKDDLVGAGGIMDLWTREARLFKYGSGTGTNFSDLRGKGEPLSGGGKSSGLMSFLRVGDRAAGAIKSGGTCLAPKQKLLTAKGPIAVKDLCGTNFIVLSYDPPANRYKAKKATAWKAGVKKVVRVTTDKGCFELSFDHPMKVAGSGKFVESGKLQAGMSLWACTTNNKDGYVRVNLKDGKKGKRFLHQMVIEDILGKELSFPESVVHHKNGDKTDNELKNLEVVAQSNHASDHNNQLVADGTHHFQNNAYPKNGNSNGMHKDSPFWKSNKAEAYKQSKSVELLDRNPVELRTLAANQKMLNTAWQLINEGYSISTFDAYIKSRKAFFGKIGSVSKVRASINERFGSYADFLVQLSLQNHRVISVEEIGEMEVYDVEVDCPTVDDKSPQTGHDFVIWDGDTSFGSGVVVSNTRRAAKMVCLDLDHPEIETFISWKSKEEKKVASLVKDGYSSDFEGEAYDTVAGQNSNNSVRVPSAFMDVLKDDGEWHLRWRTDPTHICKTVNAKKLWKQIAQSAWECADPGVQYDDIINDWHTCPKGGRINASNPCVTGDSLVATENGLVRIDNMLDSKHVVICGDGYPREIDPAFKTGTKQVYKLTTKSGYNLRGTPDHLVETTVGDIPLVELTKEHIISLEGAGFGTKTLDGALAELIGVVAGDGCISKGSVQITLGDMDKVIAERLALTITEFKSVLKTGDTRTKRPVTANKPQGTWRVATSNKELIAIISTYLVADSGSSGKVFTDAFWGLDKESQAIVISGLFTTDGCVIDSADKSQYVGLDSTSEYLLEQVQLALLSFNIKSKIYKNRRALNKITALLPEGKGGTKEYPVKQMHSLRITKSSRFVFAAVIGFLKGSVKTHKLKLLNERVKGYQERFVDEVASVEYCGVEDVYDLTEPATSHFVANGIVIHNCAEYNFIDDTACNLASMNLVKFLGTSAEGESTFDVEGFKHTIRVSTIILEISVLMAQFPSAEIAEKSYAYRTLGLGYANLGALLMRMGVAYDSDEGRAIAGSITAIMGGESYVTSALMASFLGAFAEYKNNKDSMLRVIRNHRRATYDSIPADYEGLHVAPQRLETKHCPDYLYTAARQCWDDALHLGEKHGYRNAQVSVLAPTGTISFAMDCDTTGIEPDFALVKFKKLAGGGSFKIVNNSVAPALKSLGFEDSQCEEIVDYIVGTNSFSKAKHITRRFLGSKGLTEAQIDFIEDSLPLYFSLQNAFEPKTLGKSTLIGLGIGATKIDRILTSEAPEKFNVLERMGLTPEQIAEDNLIIWGHQTIKGSPYMTDDFIKVFDCANDISPQGHIKMLGACQSFLSGGISKTVNMPEQTTVEEVQECYGLAYTQGIKCVALYRDNCKMSQVLNTTTSGSESAFVSDVTEVKKLSAEDYHKLLPSARRRKLPNSRHGITYEIKIGGHKVYIRTGEYTTGELGELFLDMTKEGSMLRSMFNCFAVAISKSLQYGVPLEELVDTFSLTQFEPSGMVLGHTHIRLCTSVIDAVFKILALEYLNDDSYAQVKLADKDLEYSHNKETDKVIPPKILVKDSSMTNNPPCTNCGGLTIRSGTCYVCSMCGTSQGCS